MMLPQILFTLTALGGAVLASFPLRGIPRPPTWLALGHGAIAVCSFVVLIYNAATVGIPGLAQLALGVLVLAAAGGATMFLGFHLRNKPLPVPLVVGHGLIALIGVVMLWLSV
jgi:hypothetical protein